MIQATQGSTHTPVAIAWMRAADDAPQDLTGATITGTIVNVATGDVQAITGSLTAIAPATNGVFRWTYSLDDVELPGLYIVQFVATYTSDATSDATFTIEWQVIPRTGSPLGLNALIDRLAGLVPPRNSCPSGGQYVSAITGAITDLSQRAPLTRLGTLHVVAGTASYNLPADLIRLIRLPALGTPGGIYSIPGGGLMPLGRGFQERYTVAGGRIIFSPVPVYTLDRELTYAARYTLDDDGDTYPDLTDHLAEIVLLKAQVTVLLIQANKAAQDGWTYTIDDETVDKTKVPAALQAQAKLYQQQYDDAIDRLTRSSGPVGRRGRG